MRRDQTNEYSSGRTKRHSRENVHVVSERVVSKQLLYSDAFYSLGAVFVAVNCQFDGHVVTTTGRAHVQKLFSGVSISVIVTVILVVVLVTLLIVFVSIISLVVFLIHLFGVRPLGVERECAVLHHVFGDLCALEKFLEFKPVAGTSIFTSLGQQQTCQMNSMTVISFKATTYLFAV